jgi:hypothetical protein
MKIRGIISSCFFICALASCSLIGHERFELKYKNPHGYDWLFNTDYVSEIKHCVTATSTKKKPIGCFDYIGKYGIMICNIDSNSNIDFSKDIYSKKGKVVSTEHIVYCGAAFGRIEYGYNIDSTVTFNKIYISYDGDTMTNLIKNDSTIYFYSNSQYLAISSEKIKNQEIIVRYENTYRNQFSLLLMKRKRKTYLIILFPDPFSRITDQYLLYNLFNGTHDNQSPIEDMPYQTSIPEIEANINY